ncbi:MAG: GNAT family N-acetyltransferase [Pseudomonadota bacterium]
MRDGPISIRLWAEEDAQELLAMMKALAVFEGYAEAFKVTPEALITHGMGSIRRFEVVVAEDTKTQRLIGMAVTYQQPWTYDLRSTVVLKELFVVADRRGCGVGHRLMEAVIEHARLTGASRINWTVLADNHRAKAFYRQFDGRRDAKWEPWTLELA